MQNRYVGDVGDYGKCDLIRIGVTSLVLCLLLFPLELWGHSGGTDSRGGHHNRSTGEYHFHHGEPAHQHPDGVCPYTRKKSILGSLLVCSVIAGGCYVSLKKIKKAK
jgi:hypothetical protein